MNRIMAEFGCKTLDYFDDTFPDIAQRTTEQIRPGHEGKRSLATRV